MQIMPRLTFQSGTDRLPMKKKKQLTSTISARPNEDQEGNPGWVGCLKMLGDALPNTKLTQHLSS